MNPFQCLVFMAANNISFNLKDDMYCISGKGLYSYFRVPTERLPISGEALLADFIIPACEALKSEFEKKPTA